MTDDYIVIIDQAEPLEMTPELWDKIAHRLAAKSEAEMKRLYFGQFVGDVEPAPKPIPTFIIAGSWRIAEAYGFRLRLSRGAWHYLTDPHRIMGLTRMRVYLAPGFEQQPLALFEWILWRMRPNSDIQIEYLDEWDGAVEAGASHPEELLLPVISHYEPPSADELAQIEATQQRYQAWRDRQRQTKQEIAQMLGYITANGLPAKESDDAAV